MSTDYRPLRKIPFGELFDGRLEVYGVREHRGSGGVTERRRCLIDGENYLWAYSDENGFLTSVTRYGPNMVGRIVQVIGETFDTDFVSEHQPEYWGYETREEWDTAWKKIAEEHREEFYQELLKHLRGETNDITPGTIGAIQARIAEALVVERPQLMLASNKEELLKAIDVLYERDHTLRVELTDQDLAFVQLVATDEESDL